MSKMMSVFAVTMSAQLLATVATTAPAVLAPVVTRELAVSPELLGAYVSVLFGCSMLASLLAGGMVRRFGSVRTSQYAVLLVAAGLLFAATATFIGLVISALLMGAGFAVITPAASNLIIRFTPVHQLAMVFSIRQTGVPVGAGIAGAGIPALLLVTGWENALILIAVMLAATALSFQPVRWSLDDDRDRHAAIRPASILQPLQLVLKDPALRGISVGGFAFNLMQSGLLSYLVSYLNLELGYTLLAAGLVLAASQLAAVLARLFWGWLSDRFGDPLRILALLGYGSALVCVVIGCITPAWPVPLVVIVAALFGATAVAWNGVFLGGLARFSPPGEAATATAGSLFFAFLGALLGPLMYSVILSLSGHYGVGYLLFAVVPLAAGLTIRSIRMRARRSGIDNGQTRN